MTFDDFMKEARIEFANQKAGYTPPLDESEFKRAMQRAHEESVTPEKAVKAYLNRSW